MYANGKGVIQNDKEAVKWYRLAAEQEHARAQFRLGLMYENGWGVPQDFALALMWFNLSGTNGEESGTIQRKILGIWVTPQQSIKAREMAENWRPKNSRMAIKQVELSEDGKKTIEKTVSVQKQEIKSETHSKDGKEERSGTYLYKNREKREENFTDDKALTFTCNTEESQIEIKYGSPPAKLGMDSPHVLMEWKNPKPKSEKPDRVIESVNWTWEGSGICASRLWSFAKDNEVWSINEFGACAGDDSGLPKGSTGVYWLESNKNKVKICMGVDG